MSKCGTRGLLFEKSETPLLFKLFKFGFSPSCPNLLDLSAESVVICFRFNEQPHPSSLQHPRMPKIQGGKYK